MILPDINVLVTVSWLAVPAPTHRKGAGPGKLNSEGPWGLEFTFPGTIPVLYTATRAIAE